MDSVRESAKSALGFYSRRPRIAKAWRKGIRGPLRGSPQPALSIARLLLASSLLFAGCGRLSDDELEAAAAACADASPRTLGLHPYFVALNAYYLQEEAARAIRAGEPTSVELEEVLVKASALGVTVLRTWAFNDDPQKAGDSAIQVAPLEYDEVALRGLDLVLTRAFAHGIQLILPLGNYWNDYGGARQYVAWAGLPRPLEGDPRFFTDRSVIAHYREHIRRLLARQNAFDGWRYADHPAVLAWEVLNEPRNRGLDARGAALRAWIDEVAAQVKSLSPAKLIGTGEEGFEPFRSNLESAAVDFGSIHFFPESWNLPPAEIAGAGARWIKEHAALARGRNKPLILGEFALRNDGVFMLSERRAMYRGWLTCAVRTGLAGAAPWLFAYDARPEQWDRHTFYFRDGTAPQDPRNRYADIVLDASRQR